MNLDTNYSCSITYASFIFVVVKLFTFALFVFLQVFLDVTSSLYCLAFCLRNLLLFVLQGIYAGYAVIWCSFCVVSSFFVDFLGLISYDCFLWKIEFSKTVFVTFNKKLTLNSLNLLVTNITIRNLTKIIKSLFFFVFLSKISKYQFNCF